jgi:hypothetical protein
LTNSIWIMIKYTTLVLPGAGGGMEPNLKYTGSSSGQSFGSLQLQLRPKFRLLAASAPAPAPLGCPRNDQNFFSVQTETNRNSICFGCFSVCFAKPKKKFFGLFRCFGHRTGIETTETNRTFSKQTETNWKNPKKRTL